MVVIKIFEHAKIFAIVWQSLLHEIHFADNVLAPSFEWNKYDRF